MTNMKEAITSLSLDDESLFCLSLLRAWLGVFPPKLRHFGRLDPGKLHHAMALGEISDSALVSAAYVGFAPLASSYRRLTNEADRLNKVEPHPKSDAFWKDAVARENGAAREFGHARGAVKQLLRHLDAQAMESAGVSSYEALYDCKEAVLHDQSPHCPVDRETYASGPLHLWDYAKAVNEHRLDDMAFDTFRGWVLFVHLVDGVVSGHAIHPRAHRFGDFLPNPLINVTVLRHPRSELYPILHVPKAVQEAVRSLAARTFPRHGFEYVPPPLMFQGIVFPSALFPPYVCRLWAEG